MDWEIINKLKLKEAFGDIKTFQDVKDDEDYLSELFEYTSRASIFIYDDASIGHSVFITDTKGIGADKTFMIENNAHKDVFLWHIDGVLYAKESKCDCAFLSDSNLGFVEFKANAANSSDKAIIDNYEKAKSQLTLTFKDIDARCRGVGVALRKVFNLEAYAVFNRTVPANNAHQKNLAIKFLTENGFKLNFKNSTKIS